MIILSIETSCDETGVSVLEGTPELLRVRGNALASQIDLHAQYGGVFPAMAKRAHAEKIVSLLADALQQAGMLASGNTPIDDTLRSKVAKLCAHEGGLADELLAFVAAHEIPPIDHIGVTAGPGLEPALWVGINTARALGVLWQKPVAPINHMEGHIIAAVLTPTDDPTTYQLTEPAYPALSLLVSGGHTELVLMDAPLSYHTIGATRDDAVGEAFDKVARVLGLPYPGGPKISALAAEARSEGLAPDFTLPRPMLHSGDFHFSYSGLKTAVLYLARDRAAAGQSPTEDETLRKMIALEFETAAIEVLVKKTIDAIHAFGVRTLIVGGGVAANQYLRSCVTEQIAAALSIEIRFPTPALSTDNSVMIGMALYYQLIHSNVSFNEKTADPIVADGNRSF